jgi:hypothetical protein
MALLALLCACAFARRVAFLRGVVPRPELDEQALPPIGAAARRGGQAVS